MYRSRSEAKAAGWFSRRHKTPEAHIKAKAEREARLIASAKAVEERKWARANRSDKQQIAHLDRILGKGQGAKRERARLAGK